MPTMIGALAITEVEALLAEYRAARDAESRISTTWTPRDSRKYLAPDATGDPPPVALIRSDGLALFYAASTNALYGESESMKSWTAQWAVAQVLIAGGRALYIDFEANGFQVYGRLRQMGVSDDDLRWRFWYVQPDERLGSAQRADLQHVLTARPDLVVIDGVTAAMTMHGLDMLSNADAETFDRFLPRWIAQFGPAVGLVDHVTKAKDGRGSYALGAQHKRAAITGAAYTVHKRQEFGRGRVGIVELRVSKDRAGHVSGVAVGASRIVAHIVFTSHGTEDDARITVAVNPPGDRDVKAFRPTALMERLSRWIEDNADQTTNAIMAAVAGNRQAKGQALTALISERYVLAAAVGRGGKSHASIRVYRQEDDADSDVFVGTDSD